MDDERCVLPVLILNPAAVLWKDHHVEDADFPFPAPQFVAASCSPLRADLRRRYALRLAVGYVVHSRAVFDMVLLLLVPVLALHSVFCVPAAPVVFVSASRPLLAVARSEDHYAQHEQREV